MRIYIVLLVTFVAYPVFSQIIVDNDGEIIPFSQSDKYCEIFKYKDFHTIILPEYDNDSLFREYNKDISPNEGRLASGFAIDYDLDLRKHGDEFEIEEGKIWILVVKSKTAKHLEPIIKRFEIPDGAYLSFIPQNNKDEIYTLTKVNVDAGFRKGSNFIPPPMGSEIIIEYFEAKDRVSNFPIILAKVGYIFATVFNELKKTKDETHGQSLPCQVDVTCGYYSESYYINDTRWTHKGSGVFLNVEGDYSNEDKPNFF